MRGLIIRVGAVACVLLCGVGLFLGLRHRDAVANLPARLTTRFAPPSAGERQRIPPRERRLLRRAAERVGEARIVWSTNRSGNHEIVVMDLATQEPRQLTDHPHVDFASRFSPDGGAIVFLRSRREWVSFREKDAWDVYVMPLDGEARRVAERGYHPGWSADGRSIVFQRESTIHSVDLETGEESLLWDVGAAFGRAHFGDVALHPDGSRLAFAVQSYGAVVTRVGSSEYLRLTESQVCQTEWVPDSDELLWVEAEGNGGTRIVQGLPDASAPRVLMDLPGERSHEYFPALSDDGRWMVWAASARGHEHDRADYDLFLWQVGTPWDSTIRLTHHTGNDQWPDIHLDAPAGDEG